MRRHNGKFVQCQDLRANSARQKTQLLEGGENVSGGENWAGLILWYSALASFAFEAETNRTAFRRLVVSKRKTSLHAVANNQELCSGIRLIEN